MKTEHRYPDRRCPICNGRLNACAGLTHDEAPNPVDVTVCGHCAGVLVFEEGLKLRAVTDAELMAFPAQARAEIEMGRRIAAAANLKRGRWGRT